MALSTLLARSNPLVLSELMARSILLALSVSLARSVFLVLSKELAHSSSLALSWSLVINSKFGGSIMSAWPPCSITHGFGGGTLNRSTYITCCKWLRNIFTAYRFARA